MMTPVTNAHSAGPLPAMALVAALLGTMPLTDSLAQSPGAAADAGSVVGYDVKMKGSGGEEVVDQVVSAVEAADTTAQQIRKMFNADRFELVRLRDQEVRRIEPVIVRQEDVLADLHSAIETSAIFYNALRAQNIEVRKVVAVNLGERDAVGATGYKVTVFFRD